MSTKLHPERTLCGGQDVKILVLSNYLPHYFCLSCFIHLSLFPPNVSAVSPSRGGDVVVYVFDINQPSLPTPLYSVLVSISLVMAINFIP